MPNHKPSSQSLQCAIQNNKTKKRRGKGRSHQINHKPINPNHPNPSTQLNSKPPLPSPRRPLHPRITCPSHPQHLLLTLLTHLPLLLLLLLMLAIIPRVGSPGLAASLLLALLLMLGRSVVRRHIRRVRLRRSRGVCCWA